MLKRRNVMEGIVSFFKGTYGFINLPRFGYDVFVHFSAIEMDGYRFLERGEKVRFTYAYSEKGPFATRVIKISK